MQVLAAETIMSGRNYNAPTLAAAVQGRLASQAAAGTPRLILQGVQHARRFTPLAYRSTDLTLAWEPLDAASLPPRQSCRCAAVMSRRSHTLQDLADCFSLCHVTSQLKVTACWN